MFKHVFLYTFLLFFLFAIPGFAQKKNITKDDLELLTQIEDSLNLLADSMLQNTIPDNRIDYCIQFAQHLRNALEIPGSYEYPFTALAQKIHIVAPPDNSFRIFNWMIAPSTSIRRYYGVIQMAGEDGVYYPLKDFSSNLDGNAETEILTGGRWYGCEYYKILQQAVDGQKSYLLFGLNTGGLNSNKKLLDILTFSDQGPVFGAPAFVVPVPGNDHANSRILSRFILEYKKTAQVFLNYDEAKKMVMFNRLASDINDPNRKGTYAPTGQTDGFRFENGRYLFVKDAIPVLRLKDGEAPIDGVMQGG